MALQGTCGPAIRLSREHSEATRVDSLSVCAHVYTLRVLWLAIHDSFFLSQAASNLEGTCNYYLLKGTQLRTPSCNDSWVKSAFRCPSGVAPWEASRDQVPLGVLEEGLRDGNVSLQVQPLLSGNRHMEVASFLCRIVSQFPILGDTHFKAGPTVNLVNCLSGFFGAVRSSVP